MEAKGYVIGPLFNEAEQKQRKYESAVLKDKFGDKILWYCPVEAPVNDKSTLPTAVDIFDLDTKKVFEADFVIADIANGDLGSAMELGIAYALQYCRRAVEDIFKDNDESVLAEIRAALDSKGIKMKNTYAVCSDIRVNNAHKYEGVLIPVGWNQYVIGGLQSMGTILVDSFDTAVEIIEKQLASLEQKPATDNVDNAGSAESASL